MNRTSLRHHPLNLSKLAVPEEALLILEIAADHVRDLHKCALLEFHLAIKGKRSPDIRLLVEIDRSGVEFQLSRVIANYAHFRVIETAFCIGFDFER